MSDEMQYYSLWEQDYYQQPPVGMSYYPNPEEIKTLTNSEDAARITVSSPETANPVVMGPGKPKRRRSKGSPASQPTTFLNASIKEFRALVQQHTGCHNSAANSSPKGPITLCFGSATPSTNHHYY